MKEIYIHIKPSFLIKWFLFAVGIIGFTLILNSYLEHYPIVFGLSMEEAKQIAAEESCDDRNCSTMLLSSRNSSTVVVPYNSTPAFQDR